MAKKFGMDFYTDVIPDTPYQIDRTKKRDAFSIADIALLFKEPMRAYSKNDMLNIITKTDNEAKQYMRQFLYTDSLILNDWGKWDRKYFILDEGMVPRNINDKKVSWPDYIYVSKLSTMPESEQKTKWWNILTEFNIVPA